MTNTTKNRLMVYSLEEEKKENSSKTKTLMYEIDELKQKIQLLEDGQKDNDDNLDKLANLFKLGIIDENGLSIYNDMY